LQQLVLPFGSSAEPGEEEISVTKFKVVVKGGGVIYDGESLSEADSAFELFMSQ